MGRCEGYTRIFQTMKNYCCLRPHGCFDSQILEDEAGHNFEHGVNFEHGPIREADGCLFCSLSVGNMKLLRGILSFTLLEIRTKVAMTVEPPITKRPLKMQRINCSQK